MLAEQMQKTQRCIVGSEVVPFNVTGHMSN